MPGGYRKILIIYRSSPEFLRESLRLAKKEGTWVVVLKPVPEFEGELHLTFIRNLEDVLRGYALSDLEEIKKIAEEEKVLVKIRIERVSREEEILEIAEEERCDLIVVEPKKPSLLERWLSFKDRLVDFLSAKSPCPVLLLRPQG